jgi:predicted phosphoribosyltransferase
MVASGLKGDTGDTIDATVILLDDGEANGTALFAAIGEGVLSATEE